MPQKDFRCHIVVIMIRKSKSRVISVDSRPTKPHKVANEVRYDGLGHYIPSAAQFGNMLFLGKVAEIHVRSANEASMLKHVSRFSMKSDNTVILLPRHVLYSLSKNVLQLLSHKEIMHTVDSQCVSHLSTSNYREKSVLTIP